MIVLIGRWLFLLLLAATLITSCEVVEGGRISNTPAPQPATPGTLPSSATSVPFRTDTPSPDAPYPYPAP
ncbi:MAG: hypothetical protein C0183_20155 [Roseiflexus castenholzii]|nr:MAG: hypothetical protein C0183_20155 [Roseiflexus castenholzii]